MYRFYIETKEKAKNVRKHAELTVCANNLRLAEKKVRELGVKGDLHVYKIEEL